MLDLASDRATCGACGAEHDVERQNVDVWDTGGQGTFAVKPALRCGCGAEVWPDAAIVDELEAPPGRITMQSIRKGA